MRLFVEKMQLGLHGSTPADREALENLKNGTYQIEIKQPRNIKFHRKFFALLNLAFSMQEEYKTLESFRAAVSIKAGYFNTQVIHIPRFGDVTACIPRSISFAKMSEPDFDVFYSTIIDTLIRDFACGNTAEELEETVMKYINFS